MCLRVCACVHVRAGTCVWCAHGCVHLGDPHSGLKLFCFWPVFAVGLFSLCVLLSGVYPRGSKISHQSALECVTVVDSATHSKKTPHLQSAIMRLKTLPCTCIGRRRRRRHLHVESCYGNMAMLGQHKAHHLPD